MRIIHNRIRTMCVLQSYQLQSCIWCFHVTEVPYLLIFLNFQLQSPSYQWSWRQVQTIWSYTGKEHWTRQMEKMIEGFWHPLRHWLLWTDQQVSYRGTPTALGPPNFGTISAYFHSLVCGSSEAHSMRLLFPRKIRFADIKCHFVNYWISATESVNSSILSL